MSDFAATPLGLGWGCDTVAKFTPASAARLKATPFGAHPLGFVFRYVPLGQPSQADITLVERDAILGAGLLLGLVQHVNYPGWQASSGLGASHGLAAAIAADAVAYPVGCHLGLDMEGLGTQGQAVVDYVRAWAQQVQGAGYKVLLYVGYDDGLTPAQHLAAADVVDAWWSDYGPRTLPAPLAFAMKQHAQTTVAGVGIDPDEVLLDGVVSVMGPAPSLV